MPLRLPTSSPVFLIAAVCTAQVLAQLGAFTFFALLPTFSRNGVSAIRKRVS